MITALAVALTIPLLLLLPFLSPSGRRIMVFLIYGYIAGFLASLVLETAPFLSSGQVFIDIGAGPVIEGFFVVAPVIAAGLFLGETVRRGLLGYAMASGFGFSIFETLARIGTLQLTGTEALSLAFARSASSSVLHGSTAALVGFGLLLLAGLPGWTRFPVVFGLFAVSVTVHALYNLFMGYVPGGVVPGLLLPWALFFLLLVTYRGELQVTNGESKGV